MWRFESLTVEYYPIFLIFGHFGAKTPAAHTFDMSWRQGVRILLKFDSTPTTVQPAIAIAVSINLYLTLLTAEIKTLSIHGVIMGASVVIGVTRNTVFSTALVRLFCANVS